jgi:VanZ family protein
MPNELLNRRRIGWAFWALVVAWFALIFWFSNQPATDSSQMSGVLLNALHSLLGWLLPARAFDPAGLLHTLIRKSAHFLNFALYGVWVALAVLNTEWPAVGAAGRTVGATANLNNKAPAPLRFVPHMKRMDLNQPTLILLICLLTAMSDEFHQLYVPGRSAEVRDVLIDLAGSAVGVMVVFYFGAISDFGSSRPGDCTTSRSRNRT